MPTYDVQLNTDRECAVTEVTAQSIDEAFAVAAALDPESLHFEPFTEPVPINQIIVTDPDGNEWSWCDDALWLRLAADSLLIAAKNVLTALEDHSAAVDPVVRSTLSHLKEAVDRAQGRNA